MVTLDTGQNTRVRELHGDRYLYRTHPHNSHPHSHPYPAVSTSSPSPRQTDIPQTTFSIPIKDRKENLNLLQCISCWKTCKSKQYSSAEWPVLQKHKKIQPIITEVENMGDIQRLSSHYVTVFIAFSDLRVFSTLSVAATATITAAFVLQ